MLCPDRFFAFISRLDENWISTPARKNDTTVGIMPIALKIKGIDKMPTPITVFMSKVIDRIRPLSFIKYLLFCEKMHLMKLIHFSPHSHLHLTIMAEFNRFMNFN